MSEVFVVFTEARNTEQEEWTDVVAVAKTKKKAEEIISEQSLQTDAPNIVSREFWYFDYEVEE